MLLDILFLFLIGRGDVPVNYWRLRKSDCIKAYKMGNIDVIFGNTFAIYRSSSYFLDTSPLVICAADFCHSED